MSDLPPLLIAHAGNEDPGCQAVLQTLRLPALQALLAELPAPIRDAPSDDARDTAFERAHAAALGLPLPSTGIPWAAWLAARAGLDPSAPWAVLTPCHWEIGTGQVTLLDPAALALTHAEAQSLQASMAPYFAEDGLTLQILQPGTWLACGEPLRGLACASPQRVQGEDLRDFLPASPLLRRLQTEMQMLLYHHPVNTERETSGQPVVNAFWVSGAGPLPRPATTAGPPPVLVHDLTHSAQRHDWATWAQAWQRVDAEHCAPLLQAMRQGQPVTLTLTLCGLRASARIAGSRSGTWARLAARWRSPSLPTLLGAL